MSNLAFAVDPASLVVESYVHVLYGAKDPSIVLMTVNGASGRITFPSSTTWRLELVLGSGETSLALKGRDSVYNWTATTTVTLELPSYTPSAHNYFNVLDEHGLLAQLARNPGEKNWDYRTRLLSFASAQTGSHIEGLFYALAHELGIKPTSAALRVKVKRDSYSQLPSTSVYLEITPVHVVVDAEELMQEREGHLVEPRKRGFQLDYLPTYVDQVMLTDLEGNQLADRRFEVSEDGWVRLDTDEYNGSWLIARYPYRYRIDHTGLTLSQLETQLESIQVGGAQLLDVAVASGTLAAFGLMRYARRQLDDEYIDIPHARVQVTGLDNKEWQESLLNSFGTAHFTKLERFARRSAEKSNMGWDNLVLDEGIWDDDADNRALDFLPRLYDAVFGRWYCDHPGCTTYNLLEYRRHGGLCPTHGVGLMYLGVDEELVHSGVGGTDDLYATSEEVAEEL